jgi:hypothetical protein
VNKCFSKFELKIVLPQKELQMIRILPFKEKEKEGTEGRSQLSGQWKVSMFGGL